MENKECENCSVRSECESVSGVAECNAEAAKYTLSSFLDDYDNVFSSIVNLSRDAQDWRANIQDKIDTCLDYIIGKPLLALMCLDSMCKIPASMLINISAKVNGYATMIDIIADNNFVTYSDKAFANFLVTTLASYALLSTTFGEFTSRNELTATLSVIEQIKEAREDFITNVEGTIATTSEDSFKAGEEYVVSADTNLMFADLYTTTLNYIEQELLNLPLERKIILETDRNYIELCAELYGSIDEEVLEKFVSDNDITGEYIFSIPKGTEIIYYVEATA